MASLESIGSCSLDAEVTASEASDHNEDSASERTLRSLSISTRTPEADGPCKPVVGGASTPEYVKRTARLFETSTPVSDQKSAVVNGKDDHSDVACEKITNGIGVASKKPSYLGLACSISGYSGITTYDSKLREGFRSRDQSPGRLGLIGSREVSPLRQGSDKTEGFTVHSECGNFLVPPTKAITRFVVGTPSSMSDGFLEEQKPHLLEDKLKQIRSESSIVNGFGKVDSEGEFSSSVTEKGMGDKNVSSASYLKNGSPEITHSTIIDDQRHRVVHKDYIPRESSSDTVATIKESSRHFMSSMLSSSSYSALSSEPPFDRPKGEELKYSPTVTHSNIEVSVKRSPETPKTGSKDSLSAPLTSPMKRSPGAIRVVEFTSQAKSYVKTVSSNSPFVQTSSSSPSFGTNPSASPESLVGSLSDSMSSCKSFIQQRVERLYGPGALAQGFFMMRTRGLNRDVDDQVMEDVPDAEISLCSTSSSPALPVMRHLRPEFRAQLPVAVPGARKLHDDPCPEGKVVFIPVHREETTVMPVLQQQVSVESVADLQPAAPEVVLPVDQPPAILSQDSAVTLKDGHFFLNLLKQELDRLDGLASIVEADLEREQGLSEEVLGKLRTAAGQARLLMRQKLQQFEGLCHKNLAQSSEEQFPTTSEDLAGFWDMVMLQVEQVNGMFAEISELRANNWVEVKISRKVPSEPSGSAAIRRHSAPAKKASSSKPAQAESSKHAEAARKVREEARRQMMEQRRRAMREKAAAAATSSADVEIFVPLENGKHV